MTTTTLTAAQYRVLDHHINAIKTEPTAKLKREYVKINGSIVFSGGWDRTRLEIRTAMSIRGPQILLEMLTILVNLPLDNDDKDESLENLRTAKWTSSQECLDEERKMPL